MTTRQNRTSWRFQGRTGNVQCMKRAMEVKTCRPKWLGATQRGLVLSHCECNSLVKNVYITPVVGEIINEDDDRRFGVVFQFCTEVTC